MTHFARLKFAFILTVIVAGILMIADMIFSFHIEGLVFAPVIIVPVFVVAYLCAPLIEKYIRYK
jgi:hypothetical protein